MSSATATCPPHYWLVEEQASGHQHWACYRCGAEREQPQALPAERSSGAWAAYAPRTPRSEED